MHKEKLSYGLLLETSKKMQMPFADLLGGVVLEDIIARIAGSANKENFWLRNSNVIGKEQYQKNLVLHLEYDYVIGKLKKADPEKNEQTLLMDLAGQLEMIFADTESGVSYRMKKQVQKQDLRIQLNARIEEMQIPVSLKIHLMFDEKKIPKKESFVPIVFPKTEVTYYSYPVEAFLAENFIEAVVKLELIQDMKVYYDIYYLLERESVDGRKVKDYIDEECEKKQIKKETERLAMIASYRDYTYMKKKWKVFLRSIKEKEPQWEMVIERFLCFFEPIWQAVIEDFVFFGDWMPELNRFL